MGLLLLLHEAGFVFMDNYTKNIVVCDQFSPQEADSLEVFSVIDSQLVELHIRDIAIEAGLILSIGSSWYTVVKDRR